MKELGTLTASDHAALFAGAAGRDRVAFTRLVEALDDDLVRLAYVVGGDRQTAEDAAQAAWARLWHQPPRLREPTRIRSWLLTVTANEVRQTQRRLRRGSELERGANAPRDAAMDADLADLAVALHKLQSAERELLALRFAVGLTSQEIGDHLGLTAVAVRSRLLRLLGRLREDLTDA